MRVSDRHGALVHPELALVGGKRSGKDLHERRLAGTVVTHQGHDFAAVHLKIHPPQRVHTAESLVHPVHAKVGRWGGSPHRIASVCHSRSRYWQKSVAAASPWQTISFVIDGSFSMT